MHTYFHTSFLSCQPQQEDLIISGEAHSCHLPSAVLLTESHASYVQWTTTSPTKGKFGIQNLCLTEMLGIFFPKKTNQTARNWAIMRRKDHRGEQARKKSMSALPSSCASEGLALSTLALQDAYREQKGHMEMAKKKLNSQSFFTHCCVGSCINGSYCCY